MKNKQFSENEIKELYERIKKLSSSCLEDNLNNRDNESEEWRTFSLETKSGREICNSLSDDQLLSLLYEKAEFFGRSPSQNEVFWVCRDYIKLRFEKWPYALRAAGLPTSTGNGGKTLERFRIEQKEIEVFLKEVRVKAMELGRLPHPKDLPDVHKGMKKYMRTWGEVISAANIDSDVILNKSIYKIKDLEEEYIVLLEQVKEQAKLLGRAPMHSEVESDLRKKLINRCGSWRNALYQIGLKPVKRMKPFSTTYLKEDLNMNSKSHSNKVYDCYYKMIKLDEQTKHDLSFLKRLAEKKKKVPNKQDAPVEIRKRLKNSCGSWSNALFQIGLIKE